MVVSEKSTQKKHIPVGKRKANRFSLHSTPLTLCRRKLLGLRKQEYKTALVNISEKGLQALSKVSLEMGELYDIDFFVPGANVTLNMRAKVVWTNFYRENTGRAYYRVGFKFVKLSEEVKQQLKKLNPKSR
ncbi:MAG: PilZ domain-containing protein [Desulfobacterales bacterium]